jgi:NADPH2:quinone reductase
VVTLVSRTHRSPEGLIQYGGGAENLPQEVLQQVIDGVASGKHTIPVHKAYKLDEIVQAHEDMEGGGAAGKLVVVVDDS